jgi:SAM-dependent methyltransferase
MARSRIMNPPDPIQYEDRYGGVAEAFATYRPGYPEEVYQRILAHLAGPRERAVDVGAGTGLGTLPLCQWFREVIAIEPDVRMAAKLEGRGKSLRVLISTGEDASFPTASVDLVTSATAFHWMDGPRVLANAKQWLRPGGVLAIWAYPVPRIAGRVGEVIEAEFRDHWNTFRHQRLDDKDYMQRTVKQGPMPVVEERTIPYVLHPRAQELAGFCASTSYGSAYMRTLADPQAYLVKLLAAIEAAGGGETIAMDCSLQLSIAEKS